MAAKNIEAIYPLSPMQQGMLFHTLLAPEQGQYVAQLSCLIEGSFDVTAFKRALESTIDRHPILRTEFAWDHLNEPMQIVRRHVRLPWLDLDWRHLTESEQQEHLEKYLREDRDRGFELSKPPLMRFALMRLNEERLQFVWSNHHLIIDGWSRSIVMQEVLAFYRAYSRGEEIALAPGSPYADYIAWIQEQDLSKAEAYWRERFKGFSSPTLLSRDTSLSDRPNIDQGSSKLEVRFPASTTTALQSLAKRHQVTVNTVVQGAWALMLSRYSGSEDVVFGATVSGRPPHIAGIDRMVGMFINTLPVRVSVKCESRVGEYLKQLQEEQVEQREYDYSSLVEVQGWSDVPQGTPIFESSIVFQNFSSADRGDWQEKQQTPVLNIRVMRDLGAITHALVVHAAVDPDFRLRINYDQSRFDSATVSQLSDQLRTVIENMAANPQQSLSGISLLSKAESHRLLVEWNQTDKEIADALFVHEMFEEEARRNPDAIAVTCKHHQITFDLLNRKANQLARLLKRFNVGPDTLVPLCFNRSVDLVIAILAVLKAGGAYVPIDPDYPTQRIAFILDQIKSPVALTQQAFIEQFSHPAGQVICLDTDWEQIEDESQQNLSVELDGDNLAYVIYTSGSTGQPKGVMISHTGLSNYVSWASEAYRVKQGAGAPVHSSVGFDLTVTSLIVPLANGKAVEMVSEQGGIEELVEALRGGKGYSLVKLTPSHLEGLTEMMGEREAEGSARAYVIGGEALSWEQVERWRERCGRGVRIINEYGPTEAVVGCSVYEAEGAEAEGERNKRGNVAIGKAIWNARMYILDERMEAVGKGVVGEIYIGGAGIARGYINRAELTAERFVANPYSEQGGERLYKTGDLARYLSDGNIEFLGRIDDQVKIRGYRIELSEIATLIEQHPGISRSVVIAHEDASKEKRLVAYIVPVQGNPPVTSELQSFLKERLPEYMIPSVFAIIDEIPLTTNGKLNRRALPDPDSIETISETEYAAPRTPVEQVLATVWAEVLKADRVGVNDNFFELGGHSLHAIQIVSRIRKAFNVDLSVRSYFQAPTVAELAFMIEQMQSASDATSADEQGLIEQLGDEEFAEMLQQLDELTDEGVLALLATERESLQSN